MKGFKKVVKGPIPLQVDVITENASMEVGAVTETITVEAGGVPLAEDPETGQQGTIMQFKTMAELPQSGGGITGADWAAFKITCRALQALQTGGPRSPGARNAGDAVSINGNLPNFGNFLQDGASTLLPAKAYNSDG